MEKDKPNGEYLQQHLVIALEFRRLLEIGTIVQQLFDGFGPKTLLHVLSTIQYNRPDLVGDIYYNPETMEVEFSMDISPPNSGD